MTLWTRLLLVLLGLVLLALGLFLLVAAFGLMPQIWTGLSWLYGNRQYTIAGGGALILAVILLAIGLHSSKDKVQTILQRNELGEIRIAITAIETLVLRVTQQNSGIKESSRRVIYTEEGLVVFLRVKVLPDLVLPDLARELQEKVKEYVEHITGIAVREIKVLVDNIVTDTIMAKKQ